jgi:hypothetical protein
MARQKKRTTQPPASAETDVRPALRLEWRDASELADNPRNWRRHPDAQLAALEGAISEVGWAGACLYNERTGRLIDGHARRKIALKQGGKVPVLVGSWDEATEAKILATLDPLAGLATADPAALDQLLREVNTGCAELQQMLDDLWSEAQADAIANTEPGEPADAEPQVDRAAELAKQWGTAAGQLWLLGEHRLLCGDCRNPEDVARVMGGERADCVLTDPPYGIDAASMTMGSGQSSKPREARLSTGQTWDSDRPDVTPLLSVAAMVCIWGGQYFCRQLPISDDWLCWNKKNPNLTFAEFELAWTNYGCRCRELEHHWGGEEKQHITQKPLAVIQWAMEICPGEPQTIYDPFLGSGTTLIAAQNLGRRCFGIEISPKYCAVILQRFKDAFPGVEIRKAE